MRTLHNAAATVLALNPAIRNLDLSMVEDRLLKMGWPKERATQAISDYRRYLQAIKTADDPSLISPEADVDTVWHEHILRTKKYSEDCAAIFGGFLHHSPDEAGARLCIASIELHQELKAA